MLVYPSASFFLLKKQTNNRKRGTNSLLTIQQIRVQRGNLPVGLIVCEKSEVPETNEEDTCLAPDAEQASPIHSDHLAY